MENLPLPDGVTLGDLEGLTIGGMAGMANKDPERAAMLGDYALKYKVYQSRDNWTQQAVIVWAFERYELWRHHPAGFASLNEWLMQPEVHISQSIKSDMTFFVNAAVEFGQADPPINLFQTFREIGIDKWRNLVPKLRKANDDNQMTEIFDDEMFAEIAATATTNEMLEMLYPPGERVNFNPVAVVVEHPDGTFSFSLGGRLTFDQMEMTARKLGVKEWQDATGRRIPSPIQDLPAQQARGY